MEESLKRQQNEPWTLLSEFIRFWQANPPVFNVQAEGKLDEPKQRIRIAVHPLSSLDSTERTTRGAGETAGKTSANIYLFRTRRN